MILWTIQNVLGYEKLMDTGVLSGNLEHICFNEFKPAYDFMVLQMIKRGLKKPDGVEYPVWAWYQWQGKRRKRSTNDESLAAKGTKMVQLKIDIPDNEVLLSEFELWHFPLNNWFLYISEKESESKGHKARTKQEYEERWEMMFDVFEDVPNDCYYRLPLSKRSIQACFWQLKKEQVLETEFFVAK